MSWRDVRDLAVIVMCVMFGASALRIAVAVRQVADTADTARVQAVQQIDGARADVSAKVDAALAVATGEIRATRTEASRQITLTRLAAVSEMEASQQDLDAAVVAALKLADYHASQVEDQIDTTNVMLARTLKPIAETADAVSAAAPDLLGEYTKTARGIDEMATAWGVAAPVFVKDTEKLEGHVDHIAGDVQKLTDHAVKPKTKKEILLELLVPAALVGAKFL